MKNILKTAFVSMAVTLAGTSLAQDDLETQTQNGLNGGYSSSSTLGSSQGMTNTQSYGGVPAPVNNHPTAPQAGGNWNMPDSSGQTFNHVPYDDPNRFNNRINRLTGQPAWSQNSYYRNRNMGMLPFGASLFKGRFSNTYSDNMNPDYKISPGDRIVLRVWGAKQYDDVLVVDQQGNIFIPEIGPVYVEGINNANLQNEIEQQISHVFTSNVEIYVNLLNAQPIGVFVTGFVNNPGQYAGGSYDSIISFIDRAGGIDYERGSFRHIEIRRHNRLVTTVDLYKFILSGQTGNIRLQDRDVILVTEKTKEVTVYGQVKQEALYELVPNGESGQNLLSMVSPSNRVSHVSVSGIRNNVPFNDYLSLDDFSSFELQDGDTVDFVADRRGPSMMAQVGGAINGPSRFPIAKTTRLRELLSFVEIDPKLADSSAVYIKRRSVAELQKVTIDEALRRLEQSTLTATSQSVDEAQIRVQEAQLIQDFVKRASVVEPDGIVVVSRGGVVNNILLENGDEIIIPYISDVVLVSGEVMMPKAVTYDGSMSLDDYLAAAGGVSNRADDRNIIVAKANGEVGLADDLGIDPGDRVLVMPRFDSKNMQIAKDIMQILYQLAIATKVVVDL